MPIAFREIGAFSLFLPPMTFKKDDVMWIVLALPLVAPSRIAFNNLVLISISYLQLLAFDRLKLSLLIDISVICINCSC